MIKTDLAASRKYWNDRSTKFDFQYDALAVRKTVTRRVLELMRPSHGDVVLDLGVGTGRLYRDNPNQFFNSSKIMGVDLSPEMLAIAATGAKSAGLHQFEAVNASYTGFVLPDGSVDCAVSTLALHHVTDDDKRTVLSLLRKVIKTGGRIVIADQLNCTGRDLSESDMQTLMVRTFFPDMIESEAVKRTSVHKEYTTTLEHFAEMARAAGFNVRTEVICDFIGIVYSDSQKHAT